MYRMIKKLKRMAVAIQLLRLPSLLLGLISLTSLIVIIFFSPSGQDTHLIIPCIVGSIWGIGIYSFIITFQSVPKERSMPLSLFGKMKYAFTRAWYWLIGIIFIFGAIWTIVMTIRMISILVKD